jgi:hypothetical protein
MKSIPEDIEQYLILLGETPRRISVSTKNVAESLLCRSPGGKEWSVVENLAHLRGCADLWTHSIYAMLAMEDPVLPLIDPRRWAKVARYTGLEFHASFQAFCTQRGELLCVLKLLSYHEWERAADINGRKHTVFSQARRMARHEGVHCEQIEAILKSMH